MKLAILDAHTVTPGDLSWQGLERLAQVVCYENTKPEEIIARCQDCELVLTNKVPFSKETVQALPHLGYIGVMATGYDVIDLQAASESNVVVSNAAGYSTASVVQHTLSLLLALSNQVAENSAWAHRSWASHPYFTYQVQTVHELQGKTLGLVGFGNIGEAVGKVAHSLGMRIIVHRANPSKPLPDWATLVALDKLFSEADVVSLHCPATHESRNMVNKQRLASMKKSAVLLNTARGSLVDEQALAYALQHGEIAGAALDVLTQEPPKESPLLGAKNCLITPHMAWASFEARSKLIEILADNVRAYLMGEPQNVVNT